MLDTLAHLYVKCEYFMSPKKSHYYATHGILWRGWDRDCLMEFIKNIGQRNMATWLLLNLRPMYRMDNVSTKQKLRMHTSTHNMQLTINYCNGSITVLIHSIKPILIVHYTHPSMRHTKWNPVKITVSQLECDICLNTTSTIIIISIIYY